MAFFFRKAMSSWAVAAFAFIAILAVDISSKEYVRILFHQDQPESAASLIFNPIEVFDAFGIKFSIAYAQNTGAAWGAFEDFPDLLLIARLILVAILIWYLFARNNQPQWRMPLAMIIAGALGNIRDFFHYGYVVDMLSFNFFGYDYPVFNVADSAIFIGALLIFLMSMRSKNEVRE